MSRILSSQNRPHLFIVLIAVLARGILGGIPLIGGLISLVLLLVILFHLYKVATNFINSAPA